MPRTGGCRPAAVAGAGAERGAHAVPPLVRPGLKRQYGDVFTVRLLPRAGRWCCSRRSRIKEIFAGDPEVFHAGKGNAVLGPIMGEHSLLLVDGAQHKRARKLLMPAFRPSAMKDYQRSSPQLARDEVATWTPGRRVPQPRADERPDARGHPAGRLRRGRRGPARPAPPAGQRDRRRQADRAARLGLPLPAALRPLEEGRRGPARLDRLLYAEIAERRAAGDLHERTDVLSQLLLVGESEGEQPLSDAELRDQLVTLLLAGHETTASGLAWALYELGRHPDLMRRAQRAADEGDDDHLEAVMKESLRLHPIIPMVVRFLMRPATIGGVDLPAGVSVGPSILLSHQDPEHFPEPDRFRPERFLDGSPGRTPGSRSAGASALHRRRVLPHGGGRGPARGALGVRRDVLPGTTTSRGSATSPASRTRAPGSWSAGAAPALRRARSPFEELSQIRPARSSLSSSS